MSNPTKGEIDLMEAWFANREVPKVMYLQKSTRQNDTAKYINDVIQLARVPGVAEVILKPRWDDLVSIKEILMRTKQ